MQFLFLLSVSPNTHAFYGGGSAALGQEGSRLRVLPLAGHAERLAGLLVGALALIQQGGLVELLDIEQRLEELTLEDADHTLDSQAQGFIGWRGETRVILL